MFASNITDVFPRMVSLTHSRRACFLDFPIHRYEDAQGRALELEEVQAWAYGSHKFVSDTIEALLQCGLLLHAGRPAEREDCL